MKGILEFTELDCKLVESLIREHIANETKRLMSVNEGDRPWDELNEYDEVLLKVQWLRRNIREENHQL